MLSFTGEETTQEGRLVIARISWKQFRSTNLRLYFDL